MQTPAPWNRPTSPEAQERWDAANAVWLALDALAALPNPDEGATARAWEACHDAYEEATGFCYSDVRDPRTYTTEAAWRDAVVRDWHDAGEAARLLAEGGARTEPWAG